MRFKVDAFKQDSKLWHSEFNGSSMLIDNSIIKAHYCPEGSRIKKDSVIIISVSVDPYDVKVTHLLDDV